jgi:hypothetical protein
MPSASTCAVYLLLAGFAKVSMAQDKKNQFWHKKLAFEKIIDHACCIFKNKPLKGFPKTSFQHIDLFCTHDCR